MIIYAIPKSQHATLRNCSSFLSPYLIELSSGSSTCDDHLCLWLDSIAIPRIKMCELLKTLRFPSIVLPLKKRYLILKNMIDVVLHNYTQHEHECGHLMLNIDLKIAN